MSKLYNLAKLYFVAFIGILAALLPYSLLANENYQTNVDYIIDTDIGGDIDDVLALLVAIHSNHKPLAVTTTHIEPKVKAKIAKLILTVNGYPDIPVYAGIGVTREVSENDFLKLNPLWPPNFGYPNPVEGHKKWYEKQALAYQDAYGIQFENLAIEKESAPDFIAKIAKNYSPQFPLIIVALGPLHNIDFALAKDDTIKNNILIYTMGGDYPKGYNWLISPETTARVLDKIRTICISSELIDNYDLKITPGEFNTIEKTTHTLLGKTIIADWKNWLRIDQKNPRATQLGDPVTMYLALHPEQIDSVISQKVQFPCLDKEGHLQSEFSGCWYSMPGLDNKIIVINENEESPVYFVKSVQSAQYLKDEIIAAIVKNE